MARWGRLFISSGYCQWFNGFGIEFGFVDTQTTIPGVKVETFSLTLKFLKFILMIGIITGDMPE